MIKSTARAVGIASTYGELVTLVYDLRWMVLLAFALIFADFWLGISESKMLGKEVRRSKACRRTFNKVVDYLCYIMVAGLLGKAIGEPMGMDVVRVAAIVMLLTCAWELDSIYGHICVLHGADKDFSIRKFLIALFKARNEAVKQAAEEAKVTGEQTDKPKVTEEQIEEVRRRVHGK